MSQSMSRIPCSKVLLYGAILYGLHRFFMRKTACSVAVKAVKNLLSALVTKTISGRLRSQSFCVIIKL